MDAPSPRDEWNKALELVRIRWSTDDKFVYALALKVLGSSEQKLMRVIGSKLIYSSPPEA